MIWGIGLLMDALTISGHIRNRYDENADMNRLEVGDCLLEYQKYE